MGGSSILPNIQRKQRWRCLFGRQNLYDLHLEQPNGVYDIAANTWSSITAPLRTGNLTSDGTYLFAVGGSQFVSYDPSTGLWSNLPAPPFPFQPWGAIASHSGVIYGHQGNSYTGFAKYAISSQAWTELPSVPNGAVLGGTIDPNTNTYYAYGSYFGNNFYSFDITANAWSVASIPLFSVNDGGLAYVNQSGVNGIYLLQGEDGVGLGRFETKSGYWLSLNPTLGSTPNGSSSPLVASINAKGLAGGTYQATVKITSNDPVTHLFNLPVTLTVTGASDINLDKTELDFGQVFINQSKPATLIVVNDGSIQLSVTSLAFNSTLFTTTTLPFVVSPGSSVAIPVLFKPTTIGAFTAQLDISSNDPDEATTIVTLNGVGIEPPIIEVAPTSITQTLNSGETISRTLNIKNKGTSKLTFSTEIEDATQPASLKEMHTLAPHEFIQASPVDGREATSIVII
jgi:Abnormal spindle-like microcephaly-assoc'd, ASPM-SPD-2-Hydin